MLGQELGSDVGRNGILFNKIIADLRTVIIAGCYRRTLVLQLYFHSNNFK